MELIANNKTQEMVLNSNEVAVEHNSNFIDANTVEVSLEHLRKDCIIPVFSKDNESTISHYQFINETLNAISQEFGIELNKPDIKVSHIIKGRVPTAIGKPAKELLEHEKTIYYERMAFSINVPKITKKINGNILELNIGGVRAYNQENLYSKKSLEKFKMFIGFRNRVCTNLCVSTDGFSNEVRVGSHIDLKDKAHELFHNYNMEEHLIQLENISQYSLNEEQFAHFIGRARMYQFLPKNEGADIFPLQLNDSQLNHIVKDYYSCPNFSRQNDNSINLWSLYNLFTEANKSSYIDSNLERNVHCFELVKHLGKSIENELHSWYLHK